jgi:hypothetical protein
MDGEIQPTTDIVAICTVKSIPDSMIMYISLNPCIAMGKENNLRSCN